VTPTASLPMYNLPEMRAVNGRFWEALRGLLLERWRIGAEHAGWKFGWRDAPIAGEPGRRYVETYCYAFADPDFLEDEPQQLYWHTDIVQTTRYYMIEAGRSGIRPSPRRAGFPV
jgi:hypothetical protein